MCIFSPEGVCVCVVAVVVGVAHSMCGYVQLSEAGQRDARLLDAVDQAMPGGGRQRVDQLLLMARRVPRQQDVGVQDQPLPLRQMPPPAEQQQLTCRWISLKLSLSHFLCNFIYLNEFLNTICCHSTKNT